MSRLKIKWLSFTVTKLILVNTFLKFFKMIDAKLRSWITKRKTMDYLSLYWQSVKLQITYFYFQKQFQFLDWYQILHPKKSHVPNDNRKYIFMQLKASLSTTIDLDLPDVCRFHPDRRINIEIDIVFRHGVQNCRHNGQFGQVFVCHDENFPWSHVVKILQQNVKPWFLF